MCFSQPQAPQAAQQIPTIAVPPPAPAPPPPNAQQVRAPKSQRQRQRLSAALGTAQLRFNPNISAPR